MFQQYWGLTDSPFADALQTNWYYETPVHEEALARMYYLIEQQQRCGLVVGAAGMGKSLLLNVLQVHVKRTARKCIYIDALGQGDQELLWNLCAELQLAPAVSDSRLALWCKLQDYLLGSQRGGLETVLLFDHLERATSSCSLLIERIIHLGSGLPPSATVILSSRTGESAACGPLFDLSDLRVELAALSGEETAAYIRDQLQRAGAHTRIFDTNALVEIYSQTGGIIRDINRLCTLSLLAAMGEHCDTINGEIVKAVSRELQKPAQTRFGGRLAELEFDRVQ